MKKKVIIIISFALIAITVIGLVLLNQRTKSNIPVQTQIIAHRGFWDLEGSAQNSISSLKNAQKEKFYGSEVDVHLTLDGVVVTNHDDDIDSLLINEHTFAELQNVRLKNGESIPTLESHLKLLPENPDTKLIIEIKPKTDSEQEDMAVAAVLNLVEQMNMEKYVEYISFSKHICQELKRKSPTSIVVFLATTPATALTPQALKEEGFDGLDYHFSLIDAYPHWIKESKELGLITNVWTVNDEETMKAMLELEVDYITTDKPLELRNILQTNN